MCSLRETLSFTEFFSQDKNISKMKDGCIFGEKRNICKEFNRHDSSHVDVLNQAMKSAVDASKAQSIRVDKNDTTKNKEMAAIQTSPFVVSPETYKTLLENLYITRLYFLRARNITMNRLHVYKEEAIKHLKEIKHITEEELENPEASAESLAPELVKIATEVIEYQKALNRIELEELVKNLDSLLNTLRSDVKEAKRLAEPEYKEESKQKSDTDLISDHSQWCLFFLLVVIGSFFIFILQWVTSLLPSI